MASSFFNGPRPPKWAKRVDIVRIYNTSPESFTIISEGIDVCNYHWQNRRSERCHGVQEDCPGCQAGLEQKWAGYIHVIRWSDREALYIELSPGLAEQIVNICAGRENLRGTGLRIHRSKGGARGKYYVDLMERIIPSDELPKSVKPFELLEKLWKSKRS